MIARIHFLGVGNLGCLIAHSLRSLPEPPGVSLLLRRSSDALALKQNGGISVLRHRHTVLREGIQAEVRLSASETEGLGHESTARVPIRHLIVTTKAHQTCQALLPHADRLKRDSTVVLVQNGIGALDEIREKVFVNEETRPNLVMGITTHGVYTQKRFSVVHAAYGNLRLGIVPRHVEDDSEPPDLEKLAADPNTASTAFLLDSLQRPPSLSCYISPWNNVHLAQLEKLVVNAVINPLTTILNCTNGGILYNEHLSTVITSLVNEASAVLATIPAVQSCESSIRFSPERLYKLAIEVTKSTANNRSSMLQDATKKINLEIDYINGYIVRRGAEHGIAVFMNATVMELAKARAKMLASETKEIVG